MATLRDIAIIILAIESIFIGVLLVILLFYILSLIRLLREEIKPILEATSETVSTMRGTTAFVSETLLSPVISLISYAAAIGGAVRMLAGRRLKEKDQAFSEAHSPEGG